MNKILYFSRTFPEGTIYSNYEKIFFQKTNQILQEEEIILDYVKCNAEYEIFKGNSISLASTFMGREQDFSLFFFSIAPFVPRDKFFLWIMKNRFFLNQILEAYNLKAFPIIISTPSAFLWSNKELNIENFEGMKYNFYGRFSEVFKVLGAEEINLSFSQIKDGLLDEKINFAQGNGFTFDKEIGVTEVAKYLYVPNYYDSSIVIYFFIKLDIWKSFKESTKQKIEDLTTETFYNSYHMLEEEINILREMMRNNKLRKIEDNLEQKIIDVWKDIIWREQLNSSSTSKVLFNLYNFFEERNNFNNTINFSNLKHFDISTFKQGENVIIRAYAYKGDKISALLKMKEIISLNYLDSIIILAVLTKKDLKKVKALLKKQGLERPIYKRKGFIVNYPRIFGSILKLYEKFKQNNILQDLIIPCLNSQWIISTNNDNLAKRLINTYNYFEPPRAKKISPYLALKIKENASLEKYLDLLSRNSVNLESIIVVDKINIVIVQQYSFDLWKELISEFEVRKTKIEKEEKIEKENFIVSEQTEIVVLE